MQVGIMILSVCPGGITSNLVSYYVKGNVALAISLTVCNALLSLFSIPIMEKFLEIQYSGTIFFHNPEIFLVYGMETGNFSSLRNEFFRNVPEYRSGNFRNNLNQN